MSTIARRLGAAAAVAATTLVAPLALTATAHASAPTGAAYVRVAKSTTRTPAPTTITRQGGAIVRSVDLGDVDLGGRPGQYRSPVRGELITPANPRVKHAPLIIVAHLRNPNCMDGTFSFSCPGGKERRYDQGMVYLGVALAKQGYSVLIPDLGKLYVEGMLEEPYDQFAGFRTIVGRLRDTAVAASNGRPTRLGAGLVGAIDASHTGLLVHSRSAYEAGLAVTAWAHTRTPITSVMSYGGSFVTEPYAPRDVTPMIPDVPFLGVVGTMDNDTHYESQVWLTEQLGATRRNAALLAVVPGLGHSLVNRQLLSLHIDERICDSTCLPTSAHERFLVSSATSWFDATIRHRSTGMPLSARSPLPATLGGLPARWLAVTNGTKVNAYLGGVRGRFVPFGKGASAHECEPLGDMEPMSPGKCDIDSRGDVRTVSPVTQVTVTPTSGVRLATRALASRELVIDLAPSDDRADHAKGSPLRVTLRTLGGRVATYTIPATNPVLANRQTPEVNGTYTIGTIRLPLPKAWVNSTVTSIELTGGTATSRFEIRAVDLVGARPGPR